MNTFNGHTVRGLLIDVGGTLRPNRMALLPGDEEDRAARVAAELPLHREEAASLVAYASQVSGDAEGRLSQTTDPLIAGWLRAHGIEPETGLVIRLRRALALSAVGRVRLYEGAAELLSESRRRGLRTVLLSNVDFRDETVYREEFEAAGVAGALDGIVTSVDVGLRKPLPAIFRAALGVAGTEPSETVMIGNSERSDIVPASTLGLGTILVAIDDPVPARTRADAMVTSLREIPPLLG
ncbi:MAG TPA: HAD family hydrolase [Candidatus Dormibacteraeota bacterium]|nr:HAD family hydrolase [Candidatus Dormibacteraeota bacterium]